jgi:hypothetical protein
MLRHNAKFARLVVALLSVVLAVFMTVEVSHCHPASNPCSTHCQLCSSAHIAVDAQPSWLTGYVLQRLGVVSAGEPSPGSCAVTVTAFIRPPPVSL